MYLNVTKRERGSIWMCLSFNVIMEGVSACLHAWYAIDVCLYSSNYKLKLTINWTFKLQITVSSFLTFQQIHSRCFSFEFEYVKMAANFFALLFCMEKKMLWTILKHGNNFQFLPLKKTIPSTILDLLKLIMFLKIEYSFNNFLSHLNVFTAILCFEKIC